MLCAAIAPCSAHAPTNAVSKHRTCVPSLVAPVVRASSGSASRLWWPSVDQAHGGWSDGDLLGVSTFSCGLFASLHCLAWAPLRLVASGELVSHQCQAPVPRLMLPGTTTQSLLYSTCHESGLGQKERQPLTKKRVMKSADLSCNTPMRPSSLYSVHSCVLAPEWGLEWGACPREAHPRASSSDCA